MVAAIQLLNHAVSEEPSTRSVYRWEDLLAAIEAAAVGDSLGWEAESVLLRVVRFDGEFRLNEDSEPPHSMSPEEMLKSMAIQVLARWTGLTYLLEMQRVEATAASPVLASIVRATIRSAIPPKRSATRIEVVAEVRASPRSESVIGPIGRNIGQGPAKALLPKGRPMAAANRAVVLSHYTRYDVPWRPCAKKDLVIKVEHGLTSLSGRRRRMKSAEHEPAFA